MSVAYSKLIDSRRRSDLRFETWVERHVRGLWPQREP